LTSPAVSASARPAFSSASGGESGTMTGTRLASTGRATTSAAVSAASRRNLFGRMTLLAQIAIRMRKSIDLCERFGP
jgi:hypothetical protein